ncbi:MAG: PHP domain-containing protein [Clostridiales Family XIII bacterium]|jgi:PHP family Zn ribbon phosphoesterase|nr:PHP domain-containing protein [Clostridiales Family XIII bacterium]
MKNYSYDLHIHSALSPCADEDMTPNNIARMCMLGGVRIAALTDHNTTANCPAFFSACEDAGVVPLAGCEVTTSEEIHALCLFGRLDAAMAFGDFLYPHIPDIENRPDVFGRQTLLDGKDREVGEERKLLITATDISIDDIWDIAASHGGVAVPAHIDRPAFSLLVGFGFIPDGYPFTAYEINSGACDENGADRVDRLVAENPALAGKTILRDSDAHELAGLVREPALMALPHASAEAVIAALRG